MKKNILVALAILGVVASAYSQGTVTFNNLNSAAGLKSPVYGPQTGDATQLLQGNTATGLPVGTQVYTGPLLSGANYTAQIWSAPGNDQPESSLVAATPTTTFRTGNAAGFVTATTVTLANVGKDAAAATLQLRVWDNTTGATWDAATIKGKSALFNVANIGGDLNTPPLLAGLTSFNVGGAGPIIPEPSSFALVGLGAAALLIFRRK